MERGVEALKCTSSPLVQGFPQDVGLCSFAEASLGEFFDCILGPVLVNSNVHCSKGTSTDFLFDDILVDPVLGASVIFAC